MVLPTLALTWIIVSDDLARLKMEVAANAKLPPEQRIAGEQVNGRLWKIVNANTLRTGEEYDTASDLVQYDYSSNFDTSRVQYELTYTAVALGSKTALKKLGERWDALMMSLGRYRSVGAVQIHAAYAADGYWPVHPTSPSIQAILSAPDQATGVGPDNAEVQKMEEEDQKVREGDVSKMDFKKMKDVDDRNMARMRVLIAANSFHTAKDFANAALVYQHGSRFEEYQTAHELCLCAIILGDKDSVWLGGASYDRMLNSCGHHQRWGTQFRSDADGKYVLATVDEDGMCEFQRKTVSHYTLAESRKRKID